MRSVIAKARISTKYRVLHDKLIENAIIFGIGPYFGRRLNELV
jgi:hypothetical protein